MNRKIVNKILLISLYLIIVCVGITFAWMSSGSNPQVFQIGFIFGEAYGSDYDDSISSKYNDLSVTSCPITFDLYVQDLSGEYVLTNSLDDDYTISGIVPGDPIRFKFHFKNSSDVTSYCRLVLGGLTASDDVIYDYLYFGITSTNGYPDNFDIRYLPGQVYVCVGDDSIFSTNANTNKSSSILVDKLYIPPTSDDEYITIYAYVLLNRLASSDCENISFSLGCFRAVSA